MLLFLRQFQSKFNTALLVVWLASCAFAQDGDRSDTMGIIKAEELASASHYGAAVWEMEAPLARCAEIPPEDGLRSACPQMFRFDALMHLKSAMRHLRLSRTTSGMGELDKARDEIGRAFADQDRASSYAVGNFSSGFEADALDIKADALYVLGRVTAATDPHSGTALFCKAVDTYRAAYAAREKCSSNDKCQKYHGSDRLEKAQLRTLLTARSVADELRRLDPIRLSPSAEKEFAAGVEHARSSHMELALDDFQRASKLSPGNLAVIYNLALAESKIPGREARALLYFSTYLANAPDAPDSAEVSAEIQRLLDRQRTTLKMIGSGVEKLVPLFQFRGGESARAEYLQQLRKLVDQPMPHCGAQSRLDDYVTLDILGGGLIVSSEYLYSLPNPKSNVIDELIWDSGIYPPAFESPSVLHLSSELDELAGLPEGQLGEPLYFIESPGGTIFDLSGALYHSEQQLKNQELRLGAQGLIALYLFDDVEQAQQYLDRAAQVCPAVRPKFAEMFARSVGTSPNLTDVDKYTLAIYFESDERKLVYYRVARAKAEIKYGYYGDAADDLTHVPETALSSGSEEDRRLLSDVHEARALLSMSVGDFAGASSDFSKSIELGSQDFFTPAITRYMNGDYVGASGELEKLSGWRIAALDYLASARAHKPLSKARQRLQLELRKAEVSETLEGSSVLRLVAARVPSPRLADDVAMAALKYNNGDEVGCTYLFYLGEYALVRRQVPLAKKLFDMETSRAPEDCAEYIEYVAAGVEAKRLSVK